MQSQPSYSPAQPRSPWFYVLWGCGGCACLGAVAAIVGFVLLGMGVKKGVESLAAEARTAQVDLKVQKHAMVNKAGERYIAGTVKNISPTHTYGTVDVEFDLFDKSGKPLNSATAATKDLKPGAAWEFKAIVTDPSAATYKFREVTGFQDKAEDPSLDPETRRKMKEQRAEMDKRIKDILKKAQDNAAKPNNP